MQVQCPCCQKTLSAPEEMLGKQVECPYCSVRFQVLTGDGGASVSVPTAPLAQAVTPPPAAAPPTANPPIAAPVAPAAPSGPVGAPARFKPLANPEGVTPSPVVQVPPVAKQASAPPQAANSPTKTPTAPSQSVSSPTQTPTAPPASSTPVPPKPAAAKPAGSKPARPRKSGKKTKAPALPPTVSSPPPSNTSSTKRTVKQATFVAADPTQSRVHLGADGQLPQLVLENRPAVETKEEKPKTSNPLVLIGVLCLSFGLSVLMLFMDTSSGSGEAPTKAQTRRLLEQSYIAQDPPLEPYQLLLRQALQAHTRGDSAREKRLYRSVLDMLHAEGKNKFKGLTGVPDADRPPNDRDLEELLSTMLAEDH